MNTATRVRLIDVGETVTISPSTIKYRLNGHAQRLYPQAILCQVQKVRRVIGSKQRANRMETLTFLSFNSGR